MWIRFPIVVILYLLLIWNTEATLSKKKKTKEKKRKPKKENEVKVELPESTVIERGLLNENVTFDEIAKNHMLYSKRHKNERRFDGDVLAYVTPWNSHGYDVAKTWGKFTMISPVWFQIKRKKRGIYNVEGTQDIDKGWLKDLKKKKNPPKIVPRFLFDGWSDREYESLFSSEDEIESMTNALIDVLKENNMDGAVIEIWSQIGNKRPKDVVHVLTHMAEIFHDNDLTFILVVPPAFNKDQKVVTTFKTEEFAKLAPHVDYFSLMTYDFSTNSGHAGPSSPLPWVAMCVNFLDPEEKYRSKILTGLNFYGHMFSSRASSPIVGRDYLEFLELYKPEITWEQSIAEHYARFGNEEAGQGIVFYPTLKSIEMRLEAARSVLKTGVSIWEIGQGLDYFYDLL